MPSLPPKLLTLADLLSLLRSLHSGHTLEKTAGEIGVSLQFLSLVLSGKRKPGRKIEKFLGVRKVTMYERVGGR